MIIYQIDKDRREKILRYLDLVIEKNKSINLTRIDDREKGILLHIEDSLSCLDEFSTHDGPFIDIGTGGGFPGVPLAIASGRKGVLLDSVKKKAAAVDELIEKIGLEDQIIALGMRSEEYALEVGERFETAVVRAVSTLPAILELASPLLTEGGEVIALRGKETEESIGKANQITQKLGLVFQSARPLLLNDTYERTVCVYKKIGAPEIQLPRRNGMAQKRPLG